MGTTGLETAFPALYSMLVKPGVLNLATLVERMTAGAQLFDIPVSRIAVGAPANLVLIDLGAGWVPGEHGWESRSENCCFAGQRLRGGGELELCGTEEGHGGDKHAPGGPASHGTSASASPA